MNRSRFSILLFGAMILGASACQQKDAGTENTSTPAATEVAKPAETPAASTDPDAMPAFQLKGLDGSNLQLSSLRGKKVFVNIWASWCPPCRAEMPSIEALYNKVDKEKVAFVMLSVDEQREAGANFALNKKLVAPVYFPEEQLPRLFQVQGIPATFIFDEQGKLIKRVDGASDYDTEEYVTLLNGK
jgi:thiol-disulfide isomerase/thioredoxin